MRIILYLLSNISKLRQKCLWFWLVTLPLYDADTPRWSDTECSQSKRVLCCFQGPQIFLVYLLVMDLMSVLFAILLMFSRVMNWCYGHNGRDALHYGRLSDSIWDCLMVQGHSTLENLISSPNGIYPKW